MGGLYADHVLGARDVCNNCLQVIREERLDPTRNGFDAELESRLTRREETTEVDYGPAEIPSRSKGVFCECGVESARDRVWDYTEPDRSRFKALLRNTIETLQHKDVNVDEQRLAEVAIAAWDAGHNVDGAIEHGMEAGVARAASK